MILLLFGCSYHHSPMNNSNYRAIDNFSSLEGTYTNHGEYSKKTTSAFYYLSEIIWGTNKFSKNSKYKHTDIKLINVSSYNNELVVKAIVNNCAVDEARYVKGKDIKLDNGKIILNSSFSMGSSVHIGLSSSEKVIGLDDNGNGKFVFNEFSAGLIYMMVPFVLSGKNEVRFIKLKNNFTYDACKIANKALK